MKSYPDPNYAPPPNYNVESGTNCKNAKPSQYWSGGYFCGDVVIAGNLILGGTITEGADVEGGQASIGPCFDLIKVLQGFIVEGNACFEQSVKFERDVRVIGNFATQNAKILSNCKIDGSLCVGKEVKVNSNLGVSGTTVLSGRLLVGGGSKDCEIPELIEAQTVLTEDVLALSNVHVMGSIVAKQDFSEESISSTAYTNTLVVNNHTYREREIQVMENGQLVTLTVLVKAEINPPPGAPLDVKSCPQSVPCVNTPTPNPPCPVIEC